MKSLNAKRITAVAAGAALLGMGLAFAGSVTFQNVLVVNGSGQPVVQVVVGHAAQPSDGVAAANIAAAIGNLAYTSVPVTAAVNQTQAATVLHAQVTGSGYTISGAQVWLNETGTASVSGAYSFTALIGSVINRALILSTPQYTKVGQNTGQYAYPNSGSTISTTASPQASAYSGTSVPVNATPISNYNGGGVTFSSFGGSAYGNNDNILALSGAQVPGLAQNSGSSSETEYLWVTGFPVYNQNAKSFTLLSAGGAYQIVFGKPIYTLNGNGNPNQVAFTMLGQNWTIINATGAGKGSTTQTTAVQGGSMYLAQSLVPLTTVYVGQNLTAGAYTVQLTDLGQPNSNGISTASINVYYNGVVTNTSQVTSGTTAKFNISGKTLDVRVNSTFAGLYAYQKWAKIQLYSNVYSISNGRQFNSTYDKGWNVNLWWTNTTTSTNPTDNALYSIVIYNTSPVTLVPGQSLTFIQNPQAWKLTFVGETLGASNFDSVQLSTSSQGGTAYQNLGTQQAPGTPSITNITEPGQVLQVTSQLPGAFSYAGQQSSTVTYLLTPYVLNEAANAINGQGTGTRGALDNSIITLTYDNVNPSTWINGNNPITITVKGWTYTPNAIGGASSISASASSPSFQFTSLTANSASLITTTPFFNVTAIQLQSNRALPGQLSISVTDENSVLSTGNSVLLATLQNLGAAYTSSPAIQYQQSGLPYLSLSVAISGSNSVLYNNGGTPTTFSIASTAPSGTGASSYFTYTVNEIAVPTTTNTDTLGVSLFNTTAGVAQSSQFILNYSASNGQRNNVTYTPYSGSAIQVQTGFRTERGSSVASITPTQVTFNLAKSQDYLQFAVSAASAGTVSRNYNLYGPYGVGQSTNIPNVSIGSVTANVTVPAGAGVTVSGISQVQAIPSVSSADQPVWLTNLSTTAPIAVLDTNANSQSNLILVGSGYVNSLSQQLQNSYNITVAPTSAPIVQAYGANRILVAGFYANQTTAAANQFIQQLYAQASA